MLASLTTAGEHVTVDCPVPWVSDVLEAAADRQLRSGPAAEADLLVTVERSREPFEVEGGRPCGRGAWTVPGGLVALDVLTSGFDLRLTVEDGRPHLRYRWRPPLRDRVAAHVAAARHRLLVRQALLDYPALWAASCRGRAPLHAAVVTDGADTVLLAGPSGVGKSTLVQAELDDGLWAVSDNLVVSDGTTVWGLVEPVRTVGGTGRRTSHGRREQRLARRVDQVAPTLLAAVSRRTVPGSSVQPVAPHALAEALVTGTYMAGELRRFWPFAALLSAATGRGPAHPDVTGVSARLAAEVPAVEVVVGHHTPPRLADLLRTELLACP